MFDPSIPSALRDVVAGELEPSERIDWSGMPKPFMLTPITAGMLLFAIPWTAFAIFWTASALWIASRMPEGPPYARLFPLFGVPFILVGVALLSAPLGVYWGAKRTVYVITDRRAITFEGVWSTVIRSYRPQDITNVYRKEKGDGSGDVMFARTTRQGFSADGRLEDAAFLRVADAKDVERRLKALAEREESAR